MPIEGRLLAVRDTELFVVERGSPDGLPVIALHGGPGDDHHEFGHYLDGLTGGNRYRLVLVDQRAQGRSDRSAPPQTWTIDEMAADVSGIASALGAARYAVLGHSYGAFVALAHAVAEPGAAVATIVSSGVPASRWLDVVADNLATFEPVELREQVAASWAAEESVSTQEEFRQLMTDQTPFHFADPLDPRLAEYAAATEGAVYAPEVLRHFSASGYGGLDVEDSLGVVTQRVLVLAGRHDRTCTAEASEATAAGLPHGELVIFEQSGHMTFVEENERYVSVVRDFLDRVTTATTAG